MPRPHLAHSIVRRTQTRLQSTVLPPRPYKFHIGASFAGKPAHPHDLPKSLGAGFLDDSPIALWRDDALKRRKAVKSTSAGEDFFYMQEVSLSSIPLGTLY